jgi:hypothetical protein
MPERARDDLAGARWVKHSDADMLDRQLVAAYAGLAGIAPKGPLQMGR